MHDPMAAPEPVSSTARAFLRPADHDRRNDQYVRRCNARVPGAREVAAWRSSPAHGFTWNHVWRIAPTMWCPSRATKVPPAWPSRPRWPTAADLPSRVRRSPALYAVQPLPPGVWPSRTPPGWLSSRVGRPGAASPTTLPNAAVDARASAVSGLAGGRGGLPKRPHCACGRVLCWYERICCQKRRRWPLEQPAIATRRLPGQGGGSYIEYMMNTGHKKLATLGFLRCSSPN